MKPNMNIITRFCGLKKQAAWQQLVETKLRRLGALTMIATAQVRLECVASMRPAFRVFAALEVPGPDFHAQASGYTLPAALIKVVENLEKQIRARKKARIDQWKAHLRHGFNSGRHLA